MVLALTLRWRYTAGMVTKKTTTPKRKRTVKTTKRAKASEAKSFRVAPEDVPFFTFKLTRQTLYWLVLSVVVIAFTLWILKLQSDIQDIYNSIDANSSTIIEGPLDVEKSKKSN